MSKSLEKNIMTYPVCKIARMSAPPENSADKSLLSNKKISKCSNNSKEKNKKTNINKSTNDSQILSSCNGNKSSIQVDKIEETKEKELNTNKSINYSKENNIITYPIYKIARILEESTKKDNDNTSEIFIYFKEIEKALELNSINAIKLIYYNRKIIHRILYDKDKLIRIDDEKKLENLSFFFYLCLLIFT